MVVKKEHLTCRSVIRVHEQNQAPTTYLDMVMPSQRLNEMHVLTFFKVPLVCLADHWVSSILEFREKTFTPILS